MKQLITPQMIRREAMMLAYSGYNAIPDLEYTDKITCNCDPETDLTYLFVNFHGFTKIVKFTNKELEMSLDDLSEMKIHPCIIEALDMDKQFIHMDYT